MICEFNALVVNPMHERSPDLAFLTGSPAVVRAQAVRPQRGIGGGLEPFLGLWRWGAGEDIEVELKTCAVAIEVQIVNISAERVLDFSPDGGNAEDDVCCNNGSGNGRPPELCAELERKDEDIEPGDLGNGDIVRKREWSAKDAFTTAIGVHHQHEAGRDLRLPAGTRKSAALDAVLVVGGEVVHNLQG